MLTQPSPATGLSQGNMHKQEPAEAWELGILAGTLLCCPKLCLKTSKVLNQPLSTYLLLNW